MKHLTGFSCLNLSAITLILIFSVAGCRKDETSFGPWYPIKNDNNEPLFGVFEAHIPCPNCQRIKFGLAIYKDTLTNIPSSYIMSRIYVGMGNDRTVNSGKLTIGVGTQSDSSATVYELDSTAPDEFRLFWKVGENILFILDSNRRPRVGDAGYGYVLNKIE